MSAVKEELEKVNAAYAANFNRHDAAGIAALYASGGIHLNAAGPRMDIEALYNALFSAGFTYFGSNIDEAWSLGPDAALAMGKYRAAGKDQGGTAIERGGYWTGTYVREAGQWKVRML